MTLVIVVIIIIDTFHTMTQLKKVHDERENQHQLIIEKNVSYAVLFTLVALALYDSINYSINIMNGIIPSGINLYIPFDYRIAILLVVMVITKAVSSYYVDKKM